MTTYWTRRRIVRVLERQCVEIRRRGVVARTEVQMELDLRTPDPVVIYLKDLIQRERRRAVA